MKNPSSRHYSWFGFHPEAVPTPTTLQVDNQIARVQLSKNWDAAAAIEQEF